MYNLIDTITIITRISEGSRSEVYLASDARGELVIYKRIPGDDKTELYRRVNSVGLKSIPRLYNLNYAEGFTEVIEEYIQGVSLKSIIDHDTDRSFSFDEAVNIAKDFMTAVLELHRLDPPLIHRDLKPENILLCDDSRIVLIDLEAAREYTDPSQKHDTVLIGTRGYAAPEQFGFNQTDVRSDIYSVGVVVKQILGIADVPEKKKDAIARFISKATMFDPEQRFSDMEEMLIGFDKVVKGTSGRRTFIKVALSVVCAALIAVLVLLIVTKRAPQNTSDTATGPEYPLDIPIGDSGTKGPEGEDDWFSETQECAIGSRCTLIRFFKDDPKPLELYAYELMGTDAGDVELIKYSDDGRYELDRIKLAGLRKYDVQDGCFTITKEALLSLNPGLYYLYVKFQNGMTRDFYLKVYAKGEVPGDYTVHITEQVQYYSRSEGNNVMFHTANSFCGIEALYIDGSKLSPSGYTLTLDGTGVILNSENFKHYAVKDNADITIKMQNGRKAYGTVTMLP